MSSARIELAWVDEATCAQVGDDALMFPAKGASTKDAKSLCMGCEVRSPCLEYALANTERHGIWGGKSERERRAIAAHRAKQDASTEVAA